MSSEDEGTCSGVQHLPNDQPPHRCAPLFRWLFAPVFGETLLELVGFTRNLDKLRPVGRMWPAGLSIPAHQTLVEGMDKTDVSRFDSCITTNLCNANRWRQTTNMSNHLWKFRWSLVHFSYIISPSVLHPANTGPVCQIRLKPHFLAHEPWNRQLVIVRNLPVLVPPPLREPVSCLVEDSIYSVSPPKVDRDSRIVFESHVMTGRGQVRALCRDDMLMYREYVKNRYMWDAARAPSISLWRLHQGVPAGQQRDVPPFLNEYRLSLLGVNFISLLFREDCSFWRYEAATSPVFQRFQCLRFDDRILTILPVLFLLFVLWIFFLILIILMTFFYEGFFN